ncbi:MAG TPA: SpoIIIAH-like family protein [Paenibacillaceae bacterium]
MQNRRQTIWLVSMLSLMVILSAYYLLTEEANPAGKKSELSASTGGDDIQVTEIDPPQGEEAAGGDALSEEEALESMNRATGQAFFDQVELNRRTWFDREHERLSMIISDTANHTQEEAAAAVEDLSRLEEMDERITSLQTKLLSNYENAAVELEENRYKVIVQADTLDRRQAVDIVDLAVKELGITPDQVAVQYVP